MEKVMDVVLPQDMFPTNFDSFDSVLKWRAKYQPELEIYHYLDNDGNIKETLTLFDLDTRARALAALLQSITNPRDRIILLYPSDLEFIIGFYACMYAGMIAVPISLPRFREEDHSIKHVEAIITNADARVIIAHGSVVEKAKLFMNVPNISWISSDEYDMSISSKWIKTKNSLDDIAFLQYTSGSTGTPKGVMISHKNILHNSKLICQAFGNTANSRLISWLPFFHDMGLIGTVMQTLYVGGTAFFMSSADFLQRPLRWLQAISRYKATISGAPNFAYELCLSRISDAENLSLDLSSWDVAFNGAESVRSNTIINFTKAFEKFGFKDKSFLPCYGLAEATLFVSSTNHSSKPLIHTFNRNKFLEKTIESCHLEDQKYKTITLVGCGAVCEEVDVQIVNPETGQICPTNQIGEIWISSNSIAAGYWNDEPKTADIFNQTVAGKQNYLRTGDLGFLHQNELFLTGRLKDLIIIAGKNYYSQDIEETVQSLSTMIRVSSIASFSIDVNSEEKLIVVAELNRSSCVVSPSTGSKNDKLTDLLHEIQHTILKKHNINVYDIVLVKTTTIPKTTSGKIRRLSCKDLYVSNQLKTVIALRNSNAIEIDHCNGNVIEKELTYDRDKIICADPLEIMGYLRQIIAKLVSLPNEKIDLFRPIMEFGLNSLMVTELIARVENEKNITLDFGDIFSENTISDLAKKLATQSTTVKSRVLITRVDATQSQALSSSQKRLWFLWKYNPNNPFYNISGGIRLKGEIVEDILFETIKAIHQRHSVLRTIFKEEAGEARQVIVADQPLDYRRTDLSNLIQDTQDTQAQELALCVREHTTAAFDLEKGPLFRVHQIKLTEHEYVVLLNMHHIVSDGWSIKVLIHELSALYKASLLNEESQLPELPLQYIDYAVWQNTYATEKSFAYWKKQLEGASPYLDLPLDYIRPPVQHYRGQHEVMVLDDKLYADLKRFSKERGMTLFMLLLAGYGVLLHRYSGQDDLCIGVPTANRQRKELEGLIGFFVNTLVLRLKMNEDSSFFDYLAHIKEVCLSAYAHQEMPFDKLVELLSPERDLSRSPLFQAMFVVQDASLDELSLPNAQISLFESHSEISKFDLTLEIIPQRDGGLRCVFEYNSDLFSASRIKRMCGHYQELLKGMVGIQNISVGALPLLTANERLELLQTSESTLDPTCLDANLLSLFQEQVKQSPNAIALEHDDETMSYATLDLLSTQLAHYLRFIGVGTESLVGLCLPRSMDLIIGMLGILKAGGAYVPLDPEYPKARLSYMVEDSGVVAILTSSQLSKQLMGLKATLIYLDELNTNHYPKQISLVNEPLSLAYVIYTSGSTGKPKGVALNNMVLSNLIVWQLKQKTLLLKATTLQFASMNFDASFEEIFVAFCSGSKLVLISEEKRRNSQQLLEVLIKHQIERLFIPFVGLQALAEAAIYLNKYPIYLKEILTAGEQLKATPILRACFEQLPNAQLVNFYGPSESHVVSFYSLTNKPSTWDDYPPIGKAIANAKLYILDAHLELVPIGVPGELYVGGVCLADGYCNKPELTAERFIPNPYSSLAGERLYYTGDLARYRVDGEIDFLGRKDEQVKIRGYRVEPNEIVNHLTTMHGISEAVVLTKRTQHTTNLIAFIKKKSDGNYLSAASISEKLSEVFPEYYLPSQYVFLTDFPVTVNGKIDRQVMLLKAKDVTAIKIDYAPAQSITEIKLVKIWKDLLELEEISIDDDFFKIGGHSLIATSLVARIQKTFEQQIPLQMIFHFPTIRKLSKEIEKISNNKCIAIEVADTAINKPLSFAQQRLWFLAKMEPESSYYNMPTVIKLEGNFNHQAFSASLHEILKRHEILRTTFKELNQAPIQIIHPEKPIDYPFIDWSQQENAEQLMLDVVTKSAAEPFDLEQGPLFRCQVIKFSAKEHRVLFDFHHIIFDGWSISIFVEELCEFYKAFVANRKTALEQLPIQYSDYAVWQQGQYSQVIDKQLPYWLDKLKDVPQILELPIDKTRPTSVTYNGNIYRWSILTEDYKRIKSKVAKEETTLFMYLITVFNCLLYRYCQQDDFCIGTPIANRQFIETEKLIGFFANTLILRCEIKPSMTFNELLQQTKQTCIEAFAHQDVPFERLIKELITTRDLSRNPLFQVMFTLQNTPESKMDLPELTLSTIDIHSKTSKFDLLLSVRETSDNFECLFEYNIDLFELDSIQRMAAHFNQLLLSSLAESDVKVAYMPILNQNEILLLRQLNANDHSLPSNNTIIDIISEKLAEYSDFPALTMGKETYTYQELDKLSNRFANYLIKSFDVKPECHIGISIERSPMMIIAILGVMKTGAAYVPLDPQYPSARLGYMLSNANISLLLTQAKYFDRFSHFSVDLVDVDTISNNLSQFDFSFPNIKIFPESTVYITYTSGSTGKAKGIMMPHQPLINLLLWHQRHNQLSVGATTLQFASLSFDVSFQDIFSTMIAGGILLLITEEQRDQLVKLAQFITQENVERIFLPAVSLQQLIIGFDKVKQKCALKQIISGSEQLQLQEDLIKRLDNYLPECELRNEYGPSEAHVVTAYTVPRPLNQQPSWVQIGSALNNIQIYILDENLQQLPIGFTGELYIGGISLARGYIHQADVTAQSFLPDPFALDRPGARMYKTGDIARYLKHGGIEYLGRKDHQVKIRGFRVELNEINIAVSAIDGVQDTITLAHDDQSTLSKRLVCYIRAQDQNLHAPIIRQLLKQKLPSYMIPSSFLFMEEFPLTANGKIDHRKLPLEESFQSELYEKYVPPNSEMERLLVNIWAEVLSKKELGIDDDFFDFGGHSLLAMQIASRIEEELKINLALRKIFEYSTIRQLACYLDKLLNQDNSRSYYVINRVDATQSQALSSSQKRLWFLWKYNPSNPFYNMSGGVRLEGEIVEDILFETIKTIHQRHSVLRTIFREEAGKVRQLIVADQPLDYRRTDLSHLTKDTQAQELELCVREHATAAFDLEKGPLFKVHQIKLAEHEYVLLLNMHHIVSDGWSIKVLIHELSALYKASLLNEERKLSELPLQYIDYAVWQNTYATEKVLEKSFAYWKKQLEGASPYLDLPLDYMRPPVQHYRGQHEVIVLDNKLCADLKRFSKERGITLFMLLLAGYGVLLHRYSGQDDLCVGVPTANRQRKELEGLIGFFVNTLVLRLKMNGDSSFFDYLAHIKEVCLGAYAHQDMPFDKLVELLSPKRDLSRSPLFQAMFVVQDVSLEELSLPNAQMTLFESHSKISKFDLTLEIIPQHDGGLRCVFEYNSDLFSASRIKRMCGHYQELLRGMVGTPNISVGALPLLTPNERLELLQTSESTLDPTCLDASLLALFQEQVKQSPNAIALEHDDETMSYATLDLLSTQLAYYLRFIGVGIESLVGLCFPRSMDLIVGMLGILKAGGAYVPLDPEYPKARLSYMVEDSGVVAILTSNQFTEQLMGLKATLIYLDELNTNHYPKQISLVNEPLSLAYVIYTSGSTGKPKGVGITHLNAMGFITWAKNYFDQSWIKNILFSTSICFDLSIFEIFLPLSTGNQITIIKNILDLAESGAAITLINTVPSALTALVKLGNIPKSVTTINLAGEKIPEKLVNDLYESYPHIKQVINLYGPSEDTTYSTVYRIQNSFENINIIGEPITGTSLHLLDAFLNPVPIGVQGEIYLSGSGLSRGYLQRPDLTAERFLPNPFATSGHERIYATGDFAFRNEERQLILQGRVDDQVKIRGYRIEVGEIEATLCNIPEVEEAVVVKKNRNSDSYLVAYFKSVCELDFLLMSSKLKETLPEYMAPSLYVRVEDWPLTSSGKIDKKQLINRCDEFSISNEPIIPRDDIEKGLFDIWNDLLPRSVESIDQNFFDLGGHSIMVLQMLSRIKEHYVIEISVSTIFSNPTIRELATQIKPLSSSLLSHPIPFEFSVDTHFGKLSSAQRRIWFLESLDIDKAIYNVPVALEIIGMFSEKAFKLALELIIKRHDCLRTRFVSTDGELEALVEKEISVPYARRIVPEDKLHNTIKLLAHKLMALNQGETWVAVNLELAPDRRILLFVFHHIICDAWSINIFLKELSTYYNLLLEGKTPKIMQASSYFNFVKWQYAQMEQDLYSQQLSYWKNRLCGDLPVLELPFDRPRPAVQKFEGASYLAVLSTNDLNTLTILSKKQNVTLFMLLLSIFNVLLTKLSKQRDLCVGTSCSYRPSRLLEETFGLFVNSLALRTQIDLDLSFCEYLEQVKGMILTAFENQLVPFEAILEELDIKRDLSYSPIYQVIFQMQNAPADKIVFQGCEASHYNVDNAVAKLDLVVSVIPAQDHLYFNWEYNTALFNEDTVASFHQYYVELLRSLIRLPDAKLYMAHILPQAEYKKLVVDWNSTEKNFPDIYCIHELFEQRCHIEPNKIAISFNGIALTYAELNRRSDVLAVFLSRLNVGPEVIVGICIDRSIEMVIGILAILKAGGAYLPIDPHYPKTRRDYLTHESGIGILLTSTTLKASLNDFPGNLVIIDEELSQDLDSIRVSSSPDNLAYIIYTSGSTGKPKGVQLCHRGLVNLVLSQIKDFNITSNSKVLQFASFSFDACASEIFGVLLAGAELVIASLEQIQSGPGLVDFLNKEQIDVATFPPSLLMNLPENELPYLQTVVSAGEYCPSNLPEKWYQEKRFINVYGPTEITVCATKHICTEKTHKPIPVGRALPNVKIYLLDEYLQPVPVGVIAEVYIDSIGIARNYLNAPDLTAEKFIPHPFTTECGKRLYKSGDLGKWLPDGNLIIVGRIDDQIKLNGYRIELGEIEQCLYTHPLVKECKVLIRELASGIKQLRAYLILNTEEKNASNSIKVFLNERLPHYMVPSSILFLEKWPLTPNSKIDCNALRTINDATGDYTQDSSQPSTSMEKILAKIWSEILSVEHITRTDNFFDLGGHSILAVRLAALVKDTLKINMPVSALFKAPILSQLACELEQGTRVTHHQNLIAIQSTGFLEPIFCVHPIGGNVLFYRELAQHLGPQQPFYAFRASGIEADENPLNDVREMASKYVSELLRDHDREEYILVGWSFGAVIAYEMTQQLCKRNKKVSRLILIDPANPMETEMKKYSNNDFILDYTQVSRIFDIDHHDNLKSCSLNEQIEWLMKRVQNQKNTFSQGEISNLYESLTRLAAVYNSNLEALHLYQPVKYMSKIHLLYASQVKSTELQNATIKAWKGLCENIELIKVVGGHYSILENPHVANLATTIRNINENKPINCVNKDRVYEV